MPPGVIVIPPPAPLTDFQKHALTLYIRKKRAYYEKKDKVISRKYKWLEDLNQKDPDLEGIEISRESLEQLKKKRDDLIEEKHKLFDKLKRLLPSTEDEEPAQQMYPDMGTYSTLPGLYNNTTAVNPDGNPPEPLPGHKTPPSNYAPFPNQYGFYNNSTPYTVSTEPITPKKPSEMSPIQSDRHITKPSEMSPISTKERHYKWDDISPVHKPEESSYAPSSVVVETKANRMDSFTKAFTDTISKAMLSESLMSENQPTKYPSETPKTPSSVRQTTDRQVTDKQATDRRPETPTSTRHIDSTAAGSKNSDSAHSSTRSHETAKSGSKTPKSDSKNTPKTPDYNAKRPDQLLINKPKRSVSGTESNSSVSSKHYPPHSPHSTKKKEEVSDLPPVIKISKAEIQAKVMSWPTSHPYPKKVSSSDASTPGEKKSLKAKDSADSSGSSLLEFAFQSALFGNTMFNDPSPTQAGTAAGGAPSVPTKSPVPTTASVPSDLLAALSMSYGGKKKADDLHSTEYHQPKEPNSEKSRKRERSPDIRSPSPELVQVYQPESDKKDTKTDAKEKTPPPPPPPPPRSNSKKLTSPISSIGYTPPSPGYPGPYLSPGNFSFISPTHHPQYGQFTSPILQHSPIRSPMINPYSSPIHSSPYPPPNMLPPPPHHGMQPPPGMSSHMPHHTPPHSMSSKSRNYPSSRYL